MALKHFLYCWKRETADWMQEGGEPLEHIAGQQLKRVSAGDTVWIISYYQGEISLRARIVVGEAIDFEGASRKLGTDDLWESDYHLLAQPGTEEPLDDIPLRESVAQLRFNSKVDRLLLDSEGNVDPHQIQTMRELTLDSAEMLQEVWNESTGSEISLDQLDELAQGAGFSDPVGRKEVETTAIRLVTQLYEKEGWTVRSVETEKCGYDLHCTKKGKEKCVEVKGVSGDIPRFIITERELDTAQGNKDCEICIVTSALSPNPRIYRYSGSDLTDKYTFHALQYLAIPNENL